MATGPSDAAAPVAQTFQVQSVAGGTSNTAGVDFTINGSKGTGTAAGGKIIFQVAPTGGAGSSQNALGNALVIFNQSRIDVGNASNEATLNNPNPSGGVSLAINGTNYCYINTFNEFSLNNVGAFAWSGTSNAGATHDLLMTRAAAACLQLGKADAAAPVAQTLQVQNVVAGTSNTAGANFIIRRKPGDWNGCWRNACIQDGSGWYNGNKSKRTSYCLNTNRACRQSAAKRCYRQHRHWRRMPRMGFSTFQLVQDHRLEHQPRKPGA